MPRKTLVPMDDSPQAEAALEYALEEFPDAAITALHVIQLPDGYWTAFLESESDSPGYERARAHAREVLETAERRASRDERAIETTVEMGEPARTIVEYAIDNGFDQIVMGSHGRQGASRLLLGSVSEKVVRRAPMTVVVVHETDR